MKIQVTIDAEWRRTAINGFALVEPENWNREILWAWVEGRMVYVGTGEYPARARTYAKALAKLAKQPGCAWVTQVPAPEGLE